MLNCQRVYVFFSWCLPKPAGTWTESRTTIQSERLEDDFAVENGLVDGFQLEFLSKHMLLLYKT